jgi:hypothetical protein
MNEPLRHQAPARGFAANDLLTIPGDPSEVIDTRRLSDGNLEICAVPFLVRGLALGDVVRWDDSDLEVVSRSGHGTVWVWLGDSFHPRAEIAERIVDSGGLVEWRDENWLAVDVAAEVADSVLGAITEMENDEALKYRIARYVALPPPGAPTDLTEQALTAVESLRPALEASVVDRAITAIHANQPVHAFDLLFNSFTDDGPVLSPTQFAGLINTATALGIPWERVPAQLVSYQAPPDSASALGVILSRAGRWGGAALDWPGHPTTPIKLANTQAGESGFIFGDPAHLVRVVGPVTIAANDHSMRLTEFSYAQLFTVHRPWHTWCDVITEGAITISSTGPAVPTIPGTDIAWTSASMPTPPLDSPAAVRAAVRRLPPDLVASRWQMGIFAGLFTLLGIALSVGSPGFWSALALIFGGATLFALGVTAAHNQLVIRRTWSGFLERGFTADLHPIARLGHERAWLYFFSPIDQPFDPLEFPAALQPNPIPAITAKLSTNASHADRADKFTDSYPAAYLSLRDSDERTDLTWLVVPRKNDPLTADLLWVDPDKVG